MNTTDPHHPVLRKSGYLSLLQCPLRLWFQTHQPQLASEPSELTRDLGQVAREVALIARQRFPGGVLIERTAGDPDEPLKATQSALNDPSTSCIYNPVFVRNHLRTRLDVLERNDNGTWNIIHVKATTRAKKNHRPALALQYWVTQQHPITIERAGILTLNRSYLYDGGDLDLDQLFKFHDLTEQIVEMLDSIGTNVERYHQIATGPQPTQKIGPHCTKPYECQFYAHCSKDAPSHENPLEELPDFNYRQRAQLRDKGVYDILEIPESTELTALQHRVVESIRMGTEIAEATLQPALSSVNFPIHHIDFESFMTPVPRFRACRPYDAIPFQWSNHIEQADGTVTHDEFIYGGRDDPREQFATSLLASLGTRGTICIYSSYENLAIRELAEVLPHLSGSLLAIIERTWDLMKIIRANYYHPDFNGSFSIKRVVAALIPDLTYENLPIADGHAAMRQYIKSLSLDDEQQRQETHSQLRAYCAVDTLAMVRIRHYLQNITS